MTEPKPLTHDKHPAEPLTPEEACLDGLRDEVREAVIEGDAQDCSSADCIADAVYDIVRVRLATIDAERARPDAGLRERIEANLRHAERRPDDDFYRGKRAAFRVVLSMLDGPARPTFVCAKPALAAEFGKAGFFAPKASMEFLTQQARLMLTDALASQVRDQS